MDSSEEIKKVHDIYPDPDHDQHTDPSSPKPHPLPQRTPSINGAINYARPRPFRIPRTLSLSFPAFRDKQECALKIGIHQLFDVKMQQGAGISHVEIQTHSLIIHPHPRSQSKLSQQELIDLQRATHFDKKELQQWYKGILLANTSV